MERSVAGNLSSLPIQAVKHECEYTFTLSMAWLGEGSTEKRGQVQFPGVATGHRQAPVAGRRHASRPARRPEVHETSGPGPDLRPDGVAPRRCRCGRLGRLLRTAAPARGGGQPDLGWRSGSSTMRARTRSRRGAEPPVRIGVPPDLPWHRDATPGLKTKKSCR